MNGGSKDGIVKLKVDMRVVIGRGGAMMGENTSVCQTLESVAYQSDSLRQNPQSNF